MAVLTGVLEAAGGAVREEELAKVLEARFELLSPAEYTTLYADDGALIDSATGQEHGTVPVEAETVAGEIWADMSPQERKLLSFLEDDPAEVSVLLGLGRRQTSAIMDALRQKLMLALTAAGSDPREVAAALLRRSSEPP
ncbi:hypothetical protein [Streptomyces sp. NPDC086010]|uniref:hypothetical protein n=1 Tax=Streptomyces sp. NPDC086010 TaxID=3365745 RepID=UPI0037D5DE8C